MIISSFDVKAGETLLCDIVIVGSGAVGIPMALTLADQGLQVILLEGGGPDSDPNTQNLYSGSVADPALHSPPDTYRNRQLGGSTATWGGRCVPNDPIDFEYRPFMADSGWPITYDTVAAYYPKANEWLEAGVSDYSSLTALAPGTPPMIKGFDSNTVRTDGMERFSRPTNLYFRYRRRLELNDRLRVVHSANCTHIQLTQDGCTVEHLRASSLHGHHFKVIGQHYVLAVGGIETARLLLSSNDIQSTGVGNRHDNVGRYYMCHIAGNVGKLIFNGPTNAIRHGYEISPEGIYCRRRISLTAETQKALQVNNVILRLHFPKITDPAHRNGVLSGLFVARHFISYEYGKRLRDGDQEGIGVFLRHLLNIMTTPLYTIRFLLHWLFKRTLATRKFPSVILENKTNVFSLEVSGEQVPLRESRISLAAEKDALGLPRVHIDWRYDPQDITSVRKTLQVFAEELQRTGTGRLEVDEQKFEGELMRFGAYGGHHIGTTKMGTDPSTSVVDPDCKVHDVSNLFIASSAVFPTSSQANPTLTIVALGLRLAEHIMQLTVKEQSPAKHGAAI